MYVFSRRLFDAVQLNLLLLAAQPDLSHTLRSEVTRDRELVEQLSGKQQVALDDRTFGANAVRSVHRVAMEHNITLDG